MNTLEILLIMIVSGICLLLLTAFLLNRVLDVTRVDFKKTIVLIAIGGVAISGYLLISLGIMGLIIEPFSFLKI